MRGKTSKGSFSFRHMDELIVLLAVFFFIFGCIIIPEPPVPVELTTFADLSTSQNLQFDSPGDADEFALNISRYTTVGNSSRSNPNGTGVITSFSMRVCPTEHMGSNASNLTIHWPTGGSALFYPGTLTSCQQVQVNASEFNDYLFVHQAPSMANFASHMITVLTGGGGGEGVSLEWGISQENPKMHDIDEPITYQLLILEPSIPDDLLEQIVIASGTALPPGFDLILDAKLSGLSYTCYDWDQVRETTSPAEVYPVQMSVPGINLSSLGINLTNGTVVLNASVFDLPCPAYGTPGKYRAQVRRMLFTLDNYTGPVPTISFMDDFNTPALNPQWLFMGVSDSVLGYYVDNSASSTVEMYSEGNASGSSMYYYINHGVDGSGGAIVLEANLSNEEQPDFIEPFPEGAGILGFSINSSYPGPTVVATSELRGAFAITGNTSLVLCPDGSMVSAIPTSVGYHIFKINITNDTATYYIDGAQVSQCLNSTSDELYALVSADPLNDAFHGNIFVDWANITAYSGGPGTWSEDWNEFDHFDSPLNTTRWLMHNVSVAGGTAIYNYLPALSKIELISQPAVPSATNTANLLYFNQPISAPTTNESGVYVIASIFFNESTPNAAPGMFFVNETVEPRSLTDSIEYFRGGLFYFHNNLTMVCPNPADGIFSVNLTQVAPYVDLPPVTGWHDIGYYATNDTVVFIYDGIAIPTNCSPQNETFYVALSSDPLTDQMHGDTSLGRFELYAVEYEEEYYGDKWFDIGLLSYMGYLNNSIYSDVLIFDADAEGDFYGREFDFEVTSDTPGIVQVDNLNVTYGSLISYGPAGTSPTTTLDPNNDFSWFAINSQMDNSDMKLNSFAYNSTITDSELVLSRLDCVNMSNSRMVFSGVVYSTEDQYLGDLGGFLSELETDCTGRVENSNLEFVFLIGGSAINSDLRTLPIMIATDFENAVFDNLTLYEGRMVLNGTRMPSVFSTDVNLGDIMGVGISDFIENDTLPFGCADDSTFAIDSAKNITIADAPAASLNCRFELHNTNLLLENLTFNNEFGGIRVSLDNSSTRITNMTELVNVTTYGQLTDVVIWNVNTSLLSGPLVMSSEGIYVETGMASANDDYPETNLTEITSLFQVSLIFNNVAEWDGNITYYDGFTTNKTEAMEGGVECPPDRCYYSDFDPVAHILRVDVSNFSTYVVNYTVCNDTNDTNTTPRPRGDRDLDYNLQIEGECAGEPVTFAASSSGLGVEGLDANIYGPNSTLSLYASFETGMDGTGTFTPQEPGNYHYQVSESGYESKAGMISIIICEAEEEPPEEEPEVPQEEPEVPEEEPECTSDSDCPTGYWCMENECMLAIEGPEEEPPFLPPSVEHEVPSLVEEKQPAAEEPAPPCCLFGICIEILGICWYYWAIAIIVLLLAAAYIYYFAGEKKTAGKKKK